MRAWRTSLAVVGTLVAPALGWGYWHASHHVALQLYVNDYAFKTTSRLYDTPHDVSVTYRDADGVVLARAASVEPHGYIKAIHSDPAIGNCEQYGAVASAGPAKQRDYADCYAEYSAWLATWSLRVREADVTVGECGLRAVSVDVYTSNEEWWIWWVPLPHIGGVPRRYVSLTVTIDSTACLAVNVGAR